MNAYFCDAGVHQVFAEYIDVWPRYEEERVVELVFAESRGQAKKIANDANRGEVEFTDWRVRKVASNVDRPEGVAAGNDHLWCAVDAALDAAKEASDRE